MNAAAARPALDPDPFRAPDPVLPASSVETLQIERVDGSALESHVSAWLDLARRAIEPNIFLEPGFALPLLRDAGLPRRLAFLLVWKDSGPADFARLVGLFPILPPSGPLKLAGIAWGWAHNQVCSGVPLVDIDCASEVVDAALAWFEEDRSASALALCLVPKEGAFFAALQGVCARSSRGFTVIEEHPRAFLNHYEGSARVSSFLSSKRRKEYARVSRKLTALGTRTYASATTPAEIAPAMERFLALEHAGWKGARGTSFLSSPALAAFVRNLGRQLSADGKCRIDSLAIDGRPVGMGIVLTTGARGYYWKTAFDETYASLSPGVLFTLDLTQRQLADPTLASTDSCAIADHPMIDRIWPDRLVVCDVMIGLRRGDHRLLKRSLRIDALRRDLRRRAKAVVQRLRRFRGLKSAPSPSI